MRQISVPSSSQCDTSDTSRGKISSLNIARPTETPGGFPPAALAAKEATSTIPVVMAASGGPLLVVKSLARPGGNVTGRSGLTPDLERKRVELLTELVPALASIATVMNMIQFCSAAEDPQGPHTL